MYIFLAEEAGRLRVFTYNKQSTESRGGKLLLPQASFDVGDHVCHLQRLQLRGGHVLLYATLDGAIGFLMPLSEAEHRRLAFLSNKLLHAVPHCAGLNPRAFRAGASRTAGARELRHVLGDPPWQERVRLFSPLPLCKDCERIRLAASLLTQHAQHVEPNERLLL